MTAPTTPVPWDYVPKTQADLQRCMEDPMWRLCSGHLYKIMVKDEATGEVKGVIPFRPKPAQVALFQGLWHRMVIPKARQLGVTTCVGIFMLDHAIFVPNQRCGIIAHNLQAAEVIFRDKIKFAYDNLPDDLRAALPLVKDAADEMVFGHNNSGIRVSTSMRSGTIHRLLISEMGKIAKENPNHAREVMTGSLPAVPDSGIVIMESTPEGASGEFYAICDRAEAAAQERRTLSPKDWKLMFFPWMADAGYVADPRNVRISATEHEYFDRIERETDTDIGLPQRAWYIQTRDQNFGGDAERMRQEYPSVFSECWEKSTEGTWLAQQIARARSEGRIGVVRPVSNVPVNTFWDIGAGDGTAIWLHQHVGTQDRLIGFIEAWGEPYDHFVKALRATGHIWGIHYLPHDAEQQRQMAQVVGSPLSMLRALAPDWRFRIVPRVSDVQHGISLLRQKFDRLWIDAAACKEGIVHLSQYRKKWDSRNGVYTDTPEKLDGHSEAADALRQWAQGFDPRHITMPKRAEAADDGFTNHRRVRPRPGAMAL